MRSAASTRINSDQATPTIHTPHIDPFETTFSTLNKILYELDGMSSGLTSFSSNRTNLNRQLETLQTHIIDAQVSENELYSAIFLQKSDTPAIGTGEKPRDRFLYFDKYSDIIVEIENISNSVRSSYPLKKSNAEITRTQNLRSNLWSLFEYESQIDSLVNSYLRLSTISFENGTSRNHNVELGILNDRILMATLEHFQMP